jgi:hypothetical protein
VRNLQPAMLPGSRFGGPRSTLVMIHVTWHLTTAAFATVGAALLLAGTTLEGETADGVAALGASAATAFALVTIVLGAASSRSPRMLYRHPAPILLSATAALAWIGAL